jgi:hypothetical protein
MKVKDKVYYFSIKLDFLKNCVDQYKKDYTVIGANSEYVCIDTDDFKSLKTKGIYRGDKADFNEVFTWESHWSNSWDYISGTLYTASPSEKIAYRRIKKALEKYIYEKHGRYCNAIDFLDKIII